MNFKVHSFLLINIVSRDPSASAVWSINSPKTQHSANLRIWWHQGPLMTMIMSLRVRSCSTLWPTTGPEPPNGRLGQVMLNMKQLMVIKVTRIASPDQAPADHGCSELPRDPANNRGQGLGFPEPEPRSGWWCQRGCQWGGHSRDQGVHQEEKHTSSQG